MKLQKIGRNFSVFLLLGVFFYSTSVKEFHYAFESYAKYHAEVHTDNCDHHIHPTNKEDDCNICKLDVASLLYLTQSHYSFATVFISRSNIPQPAKVFYTTRASALYLRGPPSLA